VAKRYRLGLRAVAPALRRLGLAVSTVRDPAVAAAQLHEVASAGQDAAARRALATSMLPVDLVHDEYLFIRVLQAYESTFAALTVELCRAVDELAAGRGLDAAACLANGRELLERAAPLFSLMATVQPDAFRTFRVHTEGASAIQSRSYKRVESLCRPPDQPRLDSAAYRSVPEVRDRVLAGQRSLDQAYRAATLTGPVRWLLERRMAEFGSALLQWRRTHYRIAVRMLGTRPGTGYTEGTPYLAAVRDIPVFTAGGGPA
jgi:tryptophan 2,3-dioxygenase